MPPASLRSDSTSRSSPKSLVSQTLPPHASRSSPPPASFRSFLQEHAFLPVQAFQLSETVRGVWPLRTANKLPLPLRPALPPGHLPLPSINEPCLVLDHHSRVGVRLGDQTSFTLLFGLPAVSSAAALAFASASPFSPPPPPPPSFHRRLPLEPRPRVFFLFLFLRCPVLPHLRAPVSEEILGLPWPASSPPLPVASPEPVTRSLDLPRWILRFQSN